MKPHYAILEDKGFLDFNPIHFGYCQCRNDRLVDISEREYCLIHYVFSGKGYLNIYGETLEVHKNQIFIIPRNTPNYYKADKDDPWGIIWVGFTGNMCEKFTNLPPVMNFYSNIFFDMMQEKDINHMREEFLVQKLFELYSLLFHNITTVNYVNAVQNYITNNYMEPDVSITQMSHQLGLNRSHLSRFFKQKTGISIQQYLLNTRMSKAIELLESGESVASTARQVGYLDSFNFSKAFKRHVGITPSAYKNRITTADYYK